MAGVRSASRAHSTASILSARISSALSCANALQFAKVRAEQRPSTRTSSARGAIDQVFQQARRSTPRYRFGHDGRSPAQFGMAPEKGREHCVRGAIEFQRLPGRAAGGQEHRPGKSHGGTQDSMRVAIWSMRVRLFPRPEGGWDEAALLASQISVSPSSLSFSDEVQALYSPARS
jgi:hypothetical protein